jgi:hypothetical protein
MKSSAATFVLALFATVLAGSPLLAAPEPDEKEKEKPADTCLLGPSASTPPGGHWYYRFDRVNKRNCWYLGEAKGKPARKQVAEEDTAAAEKPVAAPPKKQAAQRSVTDARAEWPSQQASIEPESKAAAATPWPSATPADTPRTDEPRKVATTRWPELAAANPPAPAAAPPAPLAQAPPQTAQSQPQPAQAQPQAPIQPQVAPIAPPRPVAPPTAKPAAAADQPMSLPMLLTVLVAGLSVICVLLGAMFGRKKPRPTRLSRSAPMSSLEEVASPPQQPHPDRVLPEQARAPDDPNRRLQEMLAEIQRRAAA